MLFNLASIALLAVGAVATPAVVERQACVQTSYVVQAGDTLSAIAGRFKSSVCAIAQASNIPDKNKIHPLQTILVPLPGCTLAADAAVCCIPSAAARTHVVIAGDTFQGLGWRYGVATAAVQAANPSVAANSIAIGATLNIPARSANC
ncbi:hypothetical protein Micbo1qcDRAFT_179765 [Microdochium bolleyi]|uniref:LysM domain-containing protein n=1 Tax=Microdochium bolleyi TaxID=196109 RepID=A0A136INI7_9PEZI|nr:hypothetical protein Micbo1qcDRAFT_179765 [Microdochium bolleyi]